MKTLFLLLITASSYAQCKIESDKVDEFDGKRTTALKGGLWGDMAQILVQVDSNYYLNISPVGDRVGCCRTGESKVLFKLSDGEVIEFVHLGSTNCKGNFLIRLNDYMDKLSSAGITTVRLIGTQGQHTSEIRKEQDIIARGLACLMSVQ